jgi:cytochrome c553
VDPDAVAAGKAVYLTGNPATGVTACVSCHGDNAAGSAGLPRLAGQHPGYLDMSIRRYRQNQDRSEERMFKATKALNDQEIKALSAYIGSLR